MSAEQEQSVSMDDLYRDIQEVLDRHGVASAAMHIVLSDYVGGTWFPGCGDDCNSRNRCSAGNLRVAAKHLKEIADAYDRDAAEAGEPPVAEKSCPCCEDNEGPAFLN